MTRKQEKIICVIAFVFLISSPASTDAQTVIAEPSGPLQFTITFSGFSASRTLVQIFPPQSPGNTPVYIGNVTATPFIINETNSADFLLDGIGSAFAGFVKGEPYFFGVQGEPDSESSTLTAIGFSDPPTDFVVCQTSTPPSRCAGLQQEVNELRAYWTEPVDTGAGGGPSDPGVQSYTLDVSLDENFTSLVNSISVANNVGEAASVGGLEAGTFYFLRVRAVTFVADGGHSETSNRTLAIGSPSAPNVSAVGSGIDPADFIQVEWSPPADYGDGGLGGVIANETWVEVSLNSSFDLLVDSATAMAETNVAGQTDIVSYAALVVGTQYFVRIRDAHYHFGYRVYGSYSNSVAVILVGPPSAPQQANLTVSSPLELNLSWTPPVDSGAGDGLTYPLLSYQYSVYSSATQDPAAGTLTTVNTSVTSVLLTGLVLGTPYYASVRARNDAIDNAGYSRWFNETSCGGSVLYNRFATCGVVATNVPDQPERTAFVALPAAPSPAESAVFRFSWARPNNTGSGDDHHAVLHYNLVWFLPDGQIIQYQLIPTGTTELYDEELPITGLDYTVAVRAVNQAGEGAYTNVTRAGLLLPTPPRNVSTAYVTEVGRDVISTQLSFVVPNYTGFRNSSWPVAYELDVTSLNGSSFGGYACGASRTLSTGSSEYNAITNLTRGCEYEFRARASNTAGSGAWSETLRFTARGVPSLPRNFSISYNLLERIEVTWATPLDTGASSPEASELSQYVLEWGYFPDFSDVQDRAVLHASAAAFNWTALVVCLPHYFRIRAENDIGAGADSPTVSAQPNNCTVTIDVFCPADQWLRVRSTFDAKCQPCPTGSGSLPGSEFVTNCTCRVGYTGAAGQNCTACLAGTFKEVNGSSPCLSCAAGSYVNATAASVCADCPDNTWSPPASPEIALCICNRGFEGPDGTACTACAKGTFKPANGSAECGDCAAGTFLNVTGETVCIDCPPFTWSLNRSSAVRNCTCNAGYTGPSESCAGCAPGSYKARIGPQPCTACPFAADSPPASIQITLCTCNRGYTGPDGTNCSACPLSTFKNVSGDAVCWPCPADAVAPNGSASIDNCTCNAGYSGLDGGQCAACGRGLFKSQLGSAACQECTPGSAAPELGSPGCTNCTPGFYQNASAASVCEACAFQTYTEEVAALTCLPCNVSDCHVGEYRRECNRWEFGGCTPCDRKPSGTRYTHPGSPYYENNCRFECETGSLAFVDCCSVQCV